ncbi:MAG TPA: ribosomal protein S18-alanine N-acetyltransferase [Kofleriaceae bacterium]|nr:ribosomal protein S18-alanine N-acetyltransferase [Kofleriaceae bacterium]
MSQSGAKASGASAADGPAERRPAAAEARPRAVDISPMQREDLEEVLEIEKHAFRSSWPRQIFLEELEREWARLDVLRERQEDGTSRIAAYCNYWLVRDEVHLLNIATHPDLRRRGHARQLMRHMVEFARRHACRYITLEVRRSNQAAIDLYRAFDFQPVGIRPRYYVEDQEDALVMLLDVSPARSVAPGGAGPAPFNP